MDKKTAIIYVRVSTAGQAEEELPIDSQIERCRERAKDLDLNVLEVFRDDGRSGRNDNRPAFQSAIRFCELNPPDYLITWSTSRFFRNRIDAGLYKRRLDQLGIEIVYITTQIDRNTDSGWMMESVMEIFDEWYSRQIAADTMRSMIKNARDGYWNGGTPPFGLKPEPAPDNPRRKRLAINDAEAAVVQNIFAMRLTGRGTRQIAAAFNGQSLLNRGKRWNKCTIVALLKNEAMIGRTVFGRRDKNGGPILPRDHWVIVETHPPIVSIDTWNAVQDLLGEASPEYSTGSPTSNWAFTGLMRCRECGSGMQIESAKGRSRRYHYYSCSRQQKSGDCIRRRLPAELMDRWLTDIVLDDILNPTALQEVIDELAAHCSTWAVDQKQQRRQILAQKNDIEGRVLKIYELFETLGKETPNLGDLTQRLRQHKEMMTTLEGKLAEIDARKPPAPPHRSAEDLSETLRDIITTMPDKKRLRHYLGTFIRTVWIEREDALIEYDPEAIIHRHDLAVVHSRRKWLPEQATLGTKIIRRRLPDRVAIVAGARGG